MAGARLLGNPTWRHAECDTSAGFFFAVPVSSSSPGCLGRCMRTRHDVPAVATGVKHNFI